MLKSVLEVDTLNARAQEVFDLREGDYIYEVYVTDDDRVLVNMEEITETGDTVIFDYIPNMTERPEAVMYLLGFRDDFND